MCRWGLSYFRNTRRDAVSKPPGRSPFYIVKGFTKRHSLLYNSRMTEKPHTAPPSSQEDPLTDYERLSSDPKAVKARTQDPESLPCIIPSEVIALIQTVELKHTDTDDDVLAANVKTYNNKIKMIEALISKCNSFTKAIQLLRELDTLIVQRCELIGSPYGARSRNGSNTTIVLPAD